MHSHCNAWSNICIQKYFPYMTAQKDLFVYKDGKFKLLLNKK